MEWYEDLSDETIKRLKQLVYAYEDLDSHTQQILCNIPIDDLWFRDMYGRWGKVEHVEGGGGLCKGLTYRLRLGWERPEPEKKQGHWEEYAVHTEGHANGLREYCFHIGGSCLGLSRAFSMVGFGGIQFGNERGWFNAPICPLADDSKGPPVPKKVRFWVEG